VISLTVTRRVARLLRHFLEHYDIIDGPVTGSGASLHGIGVSTFYVTVAKLEAMQWVRSEWEELPTHEDRPRRRFYFLTKDGAGHARAALSMYDNRPPLWKRLTRRGPRCM
jgi:DNA-binding PadR family transcriptional regulator